MTEVSDAAIKRTQDSLGKIIKKPILTEKLLRKPPFKFLHDIIHAVIKTTSFLDGLYTDEELQSENMKDRDAKIAFLQKAIDAIKISTKLEVKARPSKIVAGLEADKTNELLVAISKAIDRKIDSTEAVALVKSGNVAAAAPKKEVKPTKTQTKSEPRKAKKETKETKEPSRKTKTTTDTKPTKKTEPNAKVSRQSSKDSVETKKTKRSSSQGNRDKEKENDKKKDRERTATLKTESVEKVPKAVEQTIEAPQTNGIVNDIIENQESKPNLAKVEPVETIVKQIDLPKDESEKYEPREEKIEKREKTPKTTPEKKSEETVDGKPEEKPKSAVPLEVTKSEESVNNPQPSPPTAVTSTAVSKKVPEKAVEKVEKPPSDKPRSSKSRKSHPKHDSEKVSDGMKTEEKLTTSKSMDKVIERSHGVKTNEVTKNSKPSRTALRSAAMRPISARPSAPRRRDRNVRQIVHTESFVQESGDQKTDKKNQLPAFDDADNIVITETITENLSAIDEPATNNMDGEIDGEQGHLVQQILETQTAILKSDAKNDISTISDDRKSITRNMTELRKMIQKLSLYITPLGKMMEYFQEDVDAMQIELLMWQKAGAAARADIKEEQRTTEKLLENFKYHLAEINNSIKDHAEQINNTTMNIIQNEEKISKLISTL
ncbi:TRAF3-interacting protein 1-like [Sitodiplosis mosellana]|uniref:TRAF3-interacting protein 1-like n=1 Tax=Sitodiplosis mosellana TaxID=263140 RepID=UPI00244473EF|nr:TRAF3-interacting protein 1-like [Sitodiplosis mosellana]